MSQLSDNELMLGVKRGQVQLMGEVYERHHLKLFNFFLRHSGSRSLSEDMLQETFIRALKYASAYKADGLLLTWLYGIARNVNIDSWKKHGPLLTAENAETVSAPQSDPAYLQELNEEARHLQLALLALSAEKRELVLLAKVRQLSIAELAGLFDCSSNTLKVRLHRALNELRNVYEQIHDPVEVKAMR